MAKFRVIAEINVEGDSIKKERDVILALQVMLGCYDDMDDSDTSITINPLKAYKEGN